MFKYIAIIFTFLLSISQSNAQQRKGEQLIEKMHIKYAEKWHTTRSFMQITEMYQNDSMIRRELWFEALQYPNLFRIDIGDTVSGNSILFRNDSLYKYQNKAMTYARRDKSNLIFMLGGMYFEPLDKVKNKLRAYGYDPTKGFDTTIDGTPIYILGANNTTEKVNQLWIDKNKLVIVRMIEFEHGAKTEMVFEDHINIAGAWMETKVSFYQNGQKLQVEYYKDCKANIKLHPLTFDPHGLHTIQWYPITKN